MKCKLNIPYYRVSICYKVIFNNYRYSMVDSHKDTDIEQHSSDCQNSFIDDSTDTTYLKSFSSYRYILLTILKSSLLLIIGNKKNTH